MREGERGVSIMFRGGRWLERDDGGTIAWKCLILGVVVAGIARAAHAKAATSDEAGGALTAFYAGVALASPALFWLLVRSAVRSAIERVRPPRP
jgi:hypothetical protein